MDLLLLRTFLVVDETGSFSAAAERLHCVQSNVTARIRKLEEHFGQPIFLRGKAGARLTGFGDLLKQRATALLNEFDGIEKELLEAAGSAAPLVLGSMETTAAARLPAVLKELRSRAPKGQITLHTGSTSDLLVKVWARKLDAAFVAGPIDPKRFRSVQAFDEQLVHVTSKATPQAEPLLAFRSGCSYRAAAQSWLRSEGRADTEILEMGTLEGILGCVEAGMGFAVAPESAIAQYRNADELSVRHLPPIYSSVKTFMIWRLDQQPGRAHRELIDILSVK